jgi:hypothetical protein
MVINSGSDITLISEEFLKGTNQNPKCHSGRKISLQQVTTKINLEQFVKLPTFFNTNKGPVRKDLEAYIVKDMSSHMILGNDYADQYSLSFIRDN